MHSTEDIKETSLGKIINFFNQKADENQSIFEDFVLTELSFERFYEKMSFYGQKNNRLCYLPLIDKKKQKATFVCPEDIYLRSHKHYNFTKEKSVDIRIKKISFGKDGKMQIHIKSIRENGISELEIKKRKIKKYANEKGYYQRHKKTLPSFVEKIAIITTKTGNTSTDIINQVGSKNDSIKLYTCDSDGKSIAHILQTVINTKKFQLAVLFRGGNEDQYMIEFSHTEVLDVIAHSPIPIATAIGHESDKPIVQSIADLYFDTPSSFAKEIKNHNTQFLNSVLQSSKITNESFYDILSQVKNRVASLKQNIASDFVLLKAEESNKRQKNINLLLILAIISIFVFAAIYLTYNN